MKIKLDLSRLLRLALHEDIGSGDKTSQLLISKNAKGLAVVVARETGLFCGGPVLQRLCKIADSSLRLKLLIREGSYFKKNQKVIKLKGSIHSILKVERTLLNFLGHLSGIATLTRKLVNRIHRYQVTLLDTRKTTPLWRSLEKYAVKTGGGKNHRFGLFDAVFVKENHRLYGDLERLKKIPNQYEIEIRNLRELKEALRLKPKVILFDNFSPSALSRAVRIARKNNSKIILEASGGINEKNIRQYARTGVNQISMGALTHSIKSLNFSLLVE